MLSSKKAESARRGLGPFSGGQLTVIVCTVLVLLLFPVGAWALSFSNVAITDPDGVNRAKVNSLGQLSVKGPVTATPALPSLFVRGPITSSSGGSYTKVIAPSVGAALVVQSIHLDWVGASAGGYATLGIGNSTCAGVAALEYHDLPVARDARDFSYQPGLIIPGGKALCLSVDATGATVFPTAYGYLVPASTIPPAPATPPAPPHP